jgi:AcrR family transcriptional regulator
MSESEIRNPIQKRSIETKEKIIEAGFELICSNGYYNTNTSKIAKKAGVSTGIIYQYFKDKHDIFLAGLEKYADNIFFPILNISEDTFSKNNFSNVIKSIIDEFVNNHKISKLAHEEIMALTHSDQEIANFFYNKDIEMTKKLSIILANSGFTPDNINEKVHIVIGLIDNLCHEIIYHKHKELNYKIMIELVVKSIINILK